MPGEASTLLLQEHFESGSDEFLKTLLAATAAGSLKAFASKWVADSRPFAREMLLKYIDDGCDRPGHRALVKGLFKVFEARKDQASDEVMAHFLVAFDRLPRRRLVTRRHWDAATRGMVESRELAPEKGMWASDPQRYALQKAYEKNTPYRADRYGLDRFSSRTRQYLKRRAIRYFRKLGSTERYRRGLLLALPLYEDAHLERAAQFLDAWGLVHALYWGSPVLERHAWQGVKVAPEQKLGDLAPAPMFPSQWKGCRDELVSLLVQARSRTVRVWTADWLRSAYSQTELQGIPTAQLRKMLSSSNEEAQSFAASLLKGASGLESLPLSEWMELLTIENPSLIATICELVEKHVSPNRLTLAQAIELACSPLAPVGLLGLKWARAKPIRGAIDIGVLTQLASARAAVVRKESATWLCEIIGSAEAAKEEHLRELVDSRYDDMRVPALTLHVEPALP